MLMIHFVGLPRRKHNKGQQEGEQDEVIDDDRSDRTMRVLAKHTFDNPNLCYLSAIRTYRRYVAVPPLLDSNSITRNARRRPQYIAKYDA